MYLKKEGFFCFRLHFYFSLLTHSTNGKLTSVCVGQNQRTSVHAYYDADDWISDYYGYEVFVTFGAKETNK